MQSELIPCACGMCDLMVRTPDRWGVHHAYAVGHNHVRSLEWKLARHVNRDRTPGACWLRTDGRTGYWQVSHFRVALSASRVAWELADGKPPSDDRDVCHTCDTPSCTRNEPTGFHEVDGVTVICHGHLFLGTDKLNNRDKVAKRRQASGERNGGARITADAVVRIRTLYAAGGHSLRSLADAFGISKSQVSRIVNDHSWHLNG